MPSFELLASIWGLLKTIGNFFLELLTFQYSILSIAAYLGIAGLILKLKGR